MKNDSSSRFTPRSTSVVLNWGSASHKAEARFRGCRVFNLFDRVRAAGNKLVTFNILSQVPNVRIPEYTEDINVARSWAEESGSVVVCRTSLTGHSGYGIVMAENAGQVVQAPLYTRYIKKMKEFRVHVAFGNVIDIQEKRKRSDYEGEYDSRIRSFHKGWVFCREGIQEPAELRDMAVRSINALGLDFGAVDIIYNERSNQCYVLEVNTAPGLEGSTVASYRDAVRNYCRENNLV